jgi:membrane fusion protein (multidrug efflux system)
MATEGADSSVSGDAFTAKGAGSTGASRFALWRRRLLLWLLPAIIVGVGVYYYGSSGRYVDTDNAYVKQDRVDVSARTSGAVLQVHVGENTHVVVGQAILGIDDTLQRIGLAAAEAQLATARAEVATVKAGYHEKQGELAVARRAAEYSVRAYQRQQQLAERQLVAAADVDTAHRTSDIAVGTIAILELQLAQTIARLAGNADMAVDQYPGVRAALAERDRAIVELGHTQMQAPREGMISHLPKPGSRAEAGRPTYAIVADHSLWVEANFKETDLEFVRAGQSVEVRVDAYGHSRWQGRVESIAQATGAEFSLLPAQNASGNWVKVVQRIPVRIQLTMRPDDPALRDGMSATVTIDTGAHTRFDRWLGRSR